METGCLRVESSPFEAVIMQPDFRAPLGQRGRQRLLRPPRFPVQHSVQLNFDSTTSLIGLLTLQLHRTHALEGSYRKHVNRENFNPSKWIDETTMSRLL